MANGHDVRPAKWSDIIDLYDDGEYSAIWGRYENGAQRELGVRWNGYDDSKGFPLSSGHPVWYVEPYYIARGILPVLLERTLAVPQSGGNKDNILTAMSELALRYSCNAIHVAVVLYAAANRGKTATLKFLIGNLESNGAAVIEKQEGCDTLFCCKYKGKTIGVATGGDYGGALNEAFDFFNKYNCDIVFCATHLRSDSGSWQAFAERSSACNARIICVRKKETDVEAAQPTVNAAQAGELMALIGQN